MYFPMLHLQSCTLPLLLLGGGGKDPMSTIIDLLECGDGNDGGSGTACLGGDGGTATVVRKFLLT